MTQELLKRNIKFLENYGVNYCGQAWDDKPFSAELDCYTNAGENIVVSLEDLTRDALVEYLNDFDINERVVMWWRDGKDPSVPFNNVRDPYDDYEEWVDKMRSIANSMPY